MNGSLTKRESQIAELFAWGASKKLVAERLFISERTVENHARKIYEKIGCSKVNELSAWWFCTTFNISFDLSPLKRSVIATVLLLLMIPVIFDNSNMVIRRRSSYRITRLRTLRREPDNKPTYEF